MFVKKLEILGRFRGLMSVNNIINLSHGRISSECQGTPEVGPSQAPDSETSGQ
jgi:hypothetical protein